MTDDEKQSHLIGYSAEMDALVELAERLAGHIKRRVMTRYFLVRMHGETVNGASYEPGDVAIAIAGGPFAVSSIDEISERDEHLARKWVEEYFPNMTGPSKAALILAYGSGLDRGLSEALMLVKEAMGVVTER